MGVRSAREAIAAEHVPGSDEPGVGQPGVGVAVPATSANLGPGYDSFGVALDVPLVAVAIPRQDRRIVAAGEGEAELPAGDDNLVWRAVEAWCAYAGRPVPDVSVRVASAIPLERGMGSSSAAAVAGLVLARALVGGQAGDTQLLALATELEGHPDNAAAAIAGGLVCCAPDGGFVRVTPSDALRPVLLVPDERKATSEARAALPSVVPLSVAAASVAHATTTFAGLVGITPLTADAMVDRLHEPARLQMMPTSRALVEGLRSAGIPAALSGAGPSVLAVLPARDDAAVARVREVVGAVAAAVEVVPSAWQLAGASVCPPGWTLGPPS